MSGYEVLKFLHVVAVIAWVGAPIAFSVLQLRLQKAGDIATLMGIGRQMETMGKLYYSPLAAATLLTGIWMVATTDGLSFEDPWIVIGFAGIAATLAIGLGVITPTGRKLLAEAQSPSPDMAAIANLTQRLKTLSAVNILILLLVVWAMVTKPGL